MNDLYDWTLKIKSQTFLCEKDKQDKILKENKNNEMWNLKSILLTEIDNTPFEHNHIKRNKYNQGYD